MFPLGVYDKTGLAPTDPNWNSHYDQLLDLLAANNLNVLIAQAGPNNPADPSSLLAVMDRAQARGVSVVMTVGNPGNSNWDKAGPSWPYHPAYTHPSVIAYKYGDEPKTETDLTTLLARYGNIRSFYSLPIITALTGETMVPGSDPYATNLWQTLGTEIRWARNYPFRRTYDLLDWYQDKLTQPMEDWCASMEAMATTPWWYIVQTFGNGKDKDFSFYWRFPTATELSAIIHLALANGARGLTAYSLQENVALTDAQLQPNTARDGSIPLDKFAEIAALIQAHADLLGRHIRASFAVAVDTGEVMGVPRTDPDTGRSYLYLVNKNAETSVQGTVVIGDSSSQPANGAPPGYEELKIYRNLESGCLLLSPVEQMTGGFTQASEIYTGATLQASSPGVFNYQLGPGEGQFWDFGA